jgi:hypothetical protein
MLRWVQNQVLAQTYSCHCRYPHVTVVKCVAHSLDLLLEDIGKLSYFSDIIEAQKRIVRFITNHHYSLGLFRQFAHKQLLKTGKCLLSITIKCLYASCANTVVALTVAVHTAAETRFYGAQIVAERMLELKAPIMQTVVSQEWSDWVTGASAKVRAEAAEVKALVLDEKTFWDRLVVMVDIFQPVVRLLRLADSTVPAASKVSAFLDARCLLDF